MVWLLGFPDGSVVKNLPASAGGTGVVGSIPGSVRSPGEGNCSPLRYSCLGRLMDRGAWRATVHGVTKLRGTENARTLDGRKSTFILQRGGE